ncbi:MAG: ATP-binding protein [Oscillospiraceae bacterium]|nr:ATP-binding protein [Oscillospiraceae bacterium]
MAYNSTVVRKVLDDFDNKSKTAVTDAAKRKKELYDKIPELWETDKKLEETHKELAAVIFSGSGCELKMEEAKKKNRDLIAKRNSLLEKAGYDKAHTDPAYECAACEDTGYQEELMCECLKKALAAESINHSGLGRAIKNQTFENFNLNYYDKKKSSDAEQSESPYRHMKEVCEECKKFAENFTNAENPEKHVKNLMFIGPSGLGKTHMSSAITCEVIKRGCDVFYDSAQSILYSFEKERFSKAGSFDSEIIDRYMSCDLLIIDDLGTEYSGNMALSSLYNLINMRLLEKKSMIISTNLTGSEMQNKYDARIMSRIIGEFTILNFIGEDIRLKKR